MIADGDQQLAARERSPELGEERACELQRIPGWAVAQLEHVSEQQHPVDVSDAAQKCIHRLRAAQQIGLVDAAEV